MANIVHFGKYYAPETGGIESVTFSLASGAAALGHNVTVVCFGKGYTKNQEIIRGVRVIRASIMALVASQPLGVGYALQCLSTAKNADIVHLHAPNMLSSLCSLFVSKKTGLLVHWHSDIINKGLLGRMFRPLESALLRRADCIIVTSQMYADSSATLAPFRNKICVVPIGVPDGMRNGSPSQLPDFLAEQIRGRNIILSVGRLVPYKGYSVLIEAAKHLFAGAVVVIVGDGQLKQKLQLAIKIAGVTDRIVLAGRLNQPDLHALFRHAALFCLPSTSRAEAFGVVLLEAMSYGLPIIATDIRGSGVPWVNQHGTSGYNVPVSDPVAIADACNQILASDELRSRLSRGARQRFLTEFEEDVSVKRMMDVYDRLVSLQNTGCENKRILMKDGGTR